MSHPTRETDRSQHRNPYNGQSIHFAKQQGTLHIAVLLLLFVTVNNAAGQMISTSVHGKNNDSSLEDREIQSAHKYFSNGALAENMINIEQQFRTMNFIWQHFVSKIAWKIKNALKALRFLYQDFESEVEVAVCYVKYFQIIPGLSSGRNNNLNQMQLSELFIDFSYTDNGRHQLLKNEIQNMKYSRDFNVAPDIIKFLILMLAQLEMIANEILQMNDKINLIWHGSDDSNISLPRLNDNNISITDIITNVYTALYLSFYGEMPTEYLSNQGDLKLGRVLMNWTKKGMELFNTHTLVKCTRKYIMKKIWNWVDGEGRIMT